MQNMQNAESGVPVKTVKNFSTSIPGAFTGKIDYCSSLLFVVFLEAICLTVSFATLVNFLVKALDSLYTCNSHWISLSCKNSAFYQLSLASLCTIASWVIYCFCWFCMSGASFSCILMRREFFAPEK